MLGGATLGSQRQKMHPLKTVSLKRREGAGGRADFHQRRANYQSSKTKLGSNPSNTSTRGSFHGAFNCAADGISCRSKVASRSIKIYQLLAYVVKR